MSTRSTIGILGKQVKSGNTFDDSRMVTSIYCHSDGYLEHNGALLDIFYSEPEQVKELISMGDMSALGYVVGIKHDFNRRSCDTEYYQQVQFMSCFYHRDRDGLGMSCPLEQYKGVLRDIPKESYTYVYVPEKKQWFVLENNVWKDLHKRILTVIPNADEILKPLSHSINPNDKEAVLKLKAYGNMFTTYRKQHPYMPTYYKLKDENDTREYYRSGGFFGRENVQYKDLHIDAIEKQKGKKIVKFTIKGSTKQNSIFIEQFMETYFSDEGIVLKNPSKFTTVLPK